MLRYIQSDTKECLELNGTANILYFKYKCAYMIYTLISDNEPSVNENFLYNELKKFALQAD